MKIGIDLDGTISDMPEFFSILTAALVKARHEVHIITYRDLDLRLHTELELCALKIRYTALHMPPGDELMEVWKAKLAARLGLDVMMEDSPEVLAALPHSVKRVWICDPEVFDLHAAIAGMRNSLC